MSKVHILWPEDVWDLWGEREAKREGRWVIESRRVAQFTAYDAAAAYIRTCEEAGPDEPIGLSWTELMASFVGRSTPPRHPFVEDSLLADWERAFIAKAAVLPVDPVYSSKEK